MADPQYLRWGDEMNALTTDGQAERIAALERENRWLRATLSTVITISESSVHAQAVSRIRSLCLAIKLRAEEGLRGADLTSETING